MATQPSSASLAFPTLQVLSQKQHRHKAHNKSFRPSPSGISPLSSIFSASSRDSRRSLKRKSKKSSHIHIHGSSNKNIKPLLHYVKPGALAQLRDAKRTAARSSSSSSCCVKRVGLRHSAEIEPLSRRDQEAGSLIITPRPIPVCGPLCPQRKKLVAPKATLPIMSSIIRSDPPAYGVAGLADTSTRGSDLTLDSLPMELLVRIVCNLHHDHLKPTFHVCKSLRQAVLIARECYFDFRTPDRVLKEVPHSFPRAETNYLLSKSHNPNAHESNHSIPETARQASKPAEWKVPLAAMQRLAGSCFPEPSSSYIIDNAQPGRVRPSTFPRPAVRIINSHRVLFNEEELCQAVAQNRI